MAALAALLVAGSLMLASPAAAQVNRLWPPGSPEAQARAPHCTDCYVQEASIRVRKDAPTEDAPIKPGTNPACVMQATNEFVGTMLAVVGPRVGANTSGNLAEAAKR